jgi:hypothetical protein
MLKNFASLPKQGYRWSLFATRSMQAILRNHFKKLAVRNELHNASVLIPFFSIFQSQKSPTAPASKRNSDRSCKRFYDRACRARRLYFCYSAGGRHEKTDEDWNSRCECGAMRGSRLASLVARKNVVALCRYGGCSNWASTDARECGRRQSAGASTRVLRSSSGALLQWPPSLRLLSSSALSVRG